MSKEPIIYLTHIQECISKIKQYTQGINENEFLNNSLVQDAVIRNLEIIGEAIGVFCMVFTHQKLVLIGFR